MARLNHSISRADEHMTLTLEGEIDISNARAMRTLLLQTLDQGDQLTLDLAAVSSMDSSGIAAIIDVHARAKEERKHFHVCAVSPRVRTALKLLCLHDMLLGSEPSG